MLVTTKKWRFDWPFIECKSSRSKIRFLILRLLHLPCRIISIRNLQHSCTVFQVLLRETLMAVPTKVLFAKWWVMCFVGVGSEHPREERNRAHLRAHFYALKERDERKFSSPRSTNRAGAF